MATPGLGGEDVQYGDVQKLKATQRIAPLPGGTPEPRPPRTIRRPTGAPSGGSAGANGEGHLFTMEDENPGQPTTAGLAVGPGPGSEALAAGTPSPDVRNQILQVLWLKYGNEEAGKMVQDFVHAKVAATEMGATPGATPPAPAGAAPPSAEEEYSGPSGGMKQEPETGIEPPVE
jgi:hypothetical protein